MSRFADQRLAANQSQFDQSFLGFVEAIEVGGIELHVAIADVDRFAGGKSRDHPFFGSGERRARFANQAQVVQRFGSMVGDFQRTQQRHGVLPRRIIHAARDIESDRDFVGAFTAHGRSLLGDQTANGSNQ